MFNWRQHFLIVLMEFNNQFNLKGFQHALHAMVANVSLELLQEDALIVEEEVQLTIDKVLCQFRWLALNVEELECQSKIHV